MELIDERKRKKIQKSKKETFFRKFQYRVILWKTKRRIRRGKMDVNGFGEFLHSYYFSIPVSLYVIQKLKENGISAHCEKTVDPGIFMLFAVTAKM